MTNEQILEELRKLKMHNSAPNPDEQLNIDNEVTEIDASIEEYNERIAELEAKLSDPNNYAYNNENEERTFTVELLQESFENQLEVMDREDAEYRNLQELATTLFTDCNNEIASLNVEIEAIERRLRKNEVAVRKNMRVQLSAEELNDLQNELAEKKARVATCEEMKEKYVADLSNYGELITANNRKRELVVGKQNSLNRIVENRKNNPVTVNKHQLRLDQDELNRLKAGVSALNSRKEYITYNPNTEIDNLIAAITAGKMVSEQTIENKSEENDEKLVGLYNQDSEEKSIENDGLVVDTLENSTPEKENDTTIVAPIISDFDDISSHSGEETPISEEEKEEDEVIDLIAAPSDLDEEREAEIEEAKEELKEKKKDPKFVALWKKFSKRAKKITTAAIAVGLTGVLILSLKSCGNGKSNKPDNDINNTSYSQTVEENDENLNYDFEEDNKQNVDTPINNNSNKSSVSTPSKSTTPSTPSAPSTPSTPVTPDVPDMPVTPDVPDTPVKPETPETPVEKETIELETGEAIASFDDIINGNLSEDTMISHGDEVGKEIDGATVKDYTEEGNAQIELEKKDENKTNTSSSKTPEEIKKALEEFMGGEITFDHDGNQWLDEIQSGKTR